MVGPHRPPALALLNSATSGLHLAVEVLKSERSWQDGDEIITPSLTFVSTNFAVLYANMVPVFADVDESLCLSPESIEQRITPRTRAVLFVGMGGNTGQFEAVKELCRLRDLPLILDAAHMAGTRLRGETPQCDAVSYSFQAVKNLPTGDAGMLCFEDAKLDALARRKSWLGISRNTAERKSGEGEYKWLYEVETIGYKYNGNSIMAAIGLAQLPHLERGNEVRRRITACYEAGLAGNPHITTIPVAEGCVSSRHLFQLEVADRDGLIKSLNAQAIYPGVHYRDNSEYPMFASQRAQVPNARRISARLVSLPLHLRLTDADVAEVIDAVNRFVPHPETS